jgi:hypothetical protein
MFRQLPTAMPCSEYLFKNKKLKKKNCKIEVLIWMLFLGAVVSGIIDHRGVQENAEYLQVHKNAVGNF